MANILLHIPAQFVTRVIAALKLKYPGYEDSSLTDAQMAKEAVRLWIIRMVREAERKTAIDDIVIDTPDEMVEGDIQPPPK